MGKTEIYLPIIGAFIAFAVVIVIGPSTINYLHKLKFGQNVRSDGPKRHLQKTGTPTMGGIMMVLATACRITA